MSLSIKPKQQPKVHFRNKNDLEWSSCNSACSFILETNGYQLLKINQNDKQQVVKQFPCHPEKHATSTRWLKRKRRKSYQRNALAEIAEMGNRNKPTV